MDYISPSITRLPLAQPSMDFPRSEGYGSLLKKNGLRWIHPDSTFEEALNIYWKTNRAPRADVSFGVDALVLPYLARFCGIAMSCPQTSIGLLNKINPAFDASGLGYKTIMLNLCAGLLERIEDDRNAEGNPVTRLTTVLEVKNRLVDTIKSINPIYAKEFLLFQVEGSLDEWRQESMKLYAHAASIDDFQGKCQMAFNRYRPAAIASLMDADCNDDIDFLQAVEGAPGLSLNPAQATQFRCEMTVASNLYADTNLAGDKTAIPYTAYAPIQYAVEHHVLAQTTKPSLSGRFPEDRMKVALWKQNLIDSFGFDYYSAEQLLKQVHRFG